MANRQNSNANSTKEKATEEFHHHVWAENHIHIGEKTQTLQVIVNQHKNYTINLTIFFNVLTGQYLIYRF